MRFQHLLIASLTLATILPAARAADAAQSTGGIMVYLGTYTGGKSKGIYVAKMDPATGKLEAPVLAAEARNPAFLAIHPNRRFLYAVNELWDNNAPTGQVSAFAIENSGKLTLLNAQPSGGRGPCHINIDPTGRVALVANYGSGSVAALPIGEDGKLAPPSSVIQHTGKGPNTRRQEGPHAHSVNFDPTGRLLFAADLGLDKIFIYRLDAAEGKLTPSDPPAATVAPGAGPRHFSFHPGGRFAYVINELACTVTAFAYDAGRGALAEIQTITTLPEDFKGQNTTAEVRVHPSGRFLYGSNRGHDSLAIYRIDEQSGKLTPIGHQKTGGRTPRNFNIEPTGRYLIAAHQDTDNLTIFRIDPQSGQLEQFQEIRDIGAPVCVRFLER